MTVYTKIIWAYTIGIILSVIAYFLIGYNGHDPMMTIQKANYVITFAKGLTIVAMLTLMVDLLVGAKRNKKLIKTILFLFILSVILFLLFI